MQMLTSHRLYNAVRPILLHSFLPHLVSTSQNAGLYKLLLSEPELASRVTSLYLYDRYNYETRPAADEKTLELLLSCLRSLKNVKNLSLINLHYKTAASIRDVDGLPSESLEIYTPNRLE